MGGNPYSNIKDAGKISTSIFKGVGMSEKKDPINHFIQPTTNIVYPKLDGDWLFNASIIQREGNTSRSPLALMPRVGLSDQVAPNPSVSGNCRFAHTSNTLRKVVAVEGTAVLLKDFLNTSTPDVVLQFNGSNLFVDPEISSFDIMAVDTYQECVISIGGVGYVINQANNVTQITGLNWFPPSGLGFTDGYVLLSRKGTRFFHWSDLNDTSFENGIYVAAPAGGSDNIGHLAVINREVYLFGELHTEVWYNAAVSENIIFTKQDGRVIGQGVISKNTVVVNGVGYNCCRGDSAFGVYSWQNGGSTKISCGAVDSELQTATTIKMMNSFELNRLMIHVQIDGDRMWSYDTVSNCWSLRDYFVGSEIDFGNVVDMFKVDGEHHLALPVYGYFRMAGTTDSAILTGESVPITAYKQTSHIVNNGYRLFHKMIEFDMGGDATALSLECSDDGGVTWKNLMYSQPTAIGKFNRYRFHRLGASRDRVYKLRWDSSNGAGLYGVYETIESGVK